MKTIYESKLDNEIVEQLNELEKVEVGSDEYVRIINGLTSLIEKSTKFKDMAFQQYRQTKLDEEDREIKFKAARNELIKSTIENGTRLVIFIGGCMMFKYGLKKSLEFELSDNPTFTSTREMFRKSLSMFRLF